MDSVNEFKSIRRWKTVNCSTIGGCRGIRMGNHHLLNKKANIMHVNQSIRRWKTVNCSTIGGCRGIRMGNHHLLWFAMTATRSAYSQLASHET